VLRLYEKRDLEEMACYELHTKVDTLDKQRLLSNDGNVWEYMDICTSYTQVITAYQLETNPQTAQL
jgi:hypothetical protein